MPQGPLGDEELGVGTGTGHPRQECAILAPCGLSTRIEIIVRGHVQRESHTTLPLHQLIHLTATHSVLLVRITRGIAVTVNIALELRTQDVGASTRHPTTTTSQTHRGQGSRTVHGRKNVNKAVNRNVGKTVNKAATKNVDKTVNKAASKSVGKTVNKAGFRKVANTVNRNVTKNAGKTVNKTVTRNASKKIKTGGAKA
ncbi:hypothetical protein FS837_001202 [Tulasnella sp. UAMH 9824]|nr:hypothetical protein FS837_001202 [Tulasnella sp. UAMH 9824]